jgi:hypothetical protein
MKINFLKRKESFPEPSGIPEGYEVAGYAVINYPIIFMLCFTPLCILGAIGILYHTTGYERLYVRIARWLYDYQSYASKMPDNIETISQLISSICFWVYAVLSAYLHEFLHVIAAPR